MVPSIWCSQAARPPPTPILRIDPSPFKFSAFAVTEDISNGTDFNRMNWDLIGSDAEQSRSVGGLETREGLANLKYAVSREFWLLSDGRISRHSMRARHSSAISMGLVAMGGVRFTLGPAFDASVIAGRQYNSPSYTGELHYEMTPTSAVVAAVTDTVTTPAARLLDNLDNMASTDARNTCGQRLTSFPAAPFQAFQHLMRCRSMTPASTTS